MVGSQAPADRRQLGRSDTTHSRWLQACMPAVLGTNMRGMMMGRTGKLFLTLAILWNAGCSSKPSSSSSSSGNPTGITVSVFPSATSVVVGQTVPFTATVTGTTNTAANWEVAGGAGGNEPPRERCGRARGNVRTPADCNLDRVRETRFAPDISQCRVRIG